MKEGFLARISTAKPSDVAEFVEITVEILRARTDYDTLSKDKDKWMDGSVTSRPMPGTYWNTKAMLMVKDKKGNLINTTLLNYPSETTQTKPTSGTDGTCTIDVRLGGVNTEPTYYCEYNIAQGSTNQYRWAIYESITGKGKCN